MDYPFKTSPNSAFKVYNNVYQMYNQTQKIYVIPFDQLQKQFESNTFELRLVDGSLKIFITPKN